MGGPPQADDYLTSYLFNLSIDGVTDTFFQEIDGLTGQIDVLEYQEGGENTMTHKLPGATRFQNIVLRRGVTTSKAFWDWFFKAVNGDVQRKNGSILMLDYKGDTKATINFKEGFPCRWEGLKLDSRDSKLSMETLEIAHKGIEISFS
jgi:phage tail-like protein